MTSGYLNFLMMTGISNSTKPSYAEGLDAGFPAIPFFSWNKETEHEVVSAGKRDTLMNWRILGTVFTSVFIAELGDKTQLATMLFASDKDTSKLALFVGASLALVVTSAIGVVAGSAISQYVSEKTLHYLAGIGFIAIGIWTVLKA